MYHRPLIFASKADELKWCPFREVAKVFTCCSRHDLTLVSCFLLMLLMEFDIADSASACELS